jgi:hypothetical protein
MNWTLGSVQWTSQPLNWTFGLVQVLFRFASSPEPDHSNTTCQTGTTELCVPGVSECMRTRVLNLGEEPVVLACSSGRHWSWCWKKKQWLWASHISSALASHQKRLALAIRIKRGTLLPLAGCFECWITLWVSLNFRQAGFSAHSYIFGCEEIFCLNGYIKAVQFELNLRTVYYN